MGVGQQTTAWVVTNLGIVGEDVPSEQTKLGPGAAIRLHDYSLAQMNSQFEKPWLFGTLENVIWREPGYHIFAMKPHLFTITRKPFVVPYSHTYVAVPTQLIHDRGQLQIIYSSTLGQRRVGEELLPPLRPWEDDTSWRHPEQGKIDQWKDGLRLNLEQEWSRAHSKY
jgi:hypothetical protein